MKPDLSPDEIDSIIERNNRLLSDLAKLEDDFTPTPLDTVMAALVAIFAVGIGVAAVVGVIHILGG